MKFIKILIIIALAGTSLFAQNTDDSAGEKQIKKDTAIENKPDLNKVKEAVSPIKNKEENSDGTVKDNPEKVLKSLPLKNKSKLSGKAAVRKKNIPVSSKNIIELNDGNYKYSRIPGIILTENRISSEVESSKIISDVNEVVPDKETFSKDDKGNNGFFNFGKNLSDIIAKGGILLLIIVIFFLYRIRNKGASSKRGSKRNVLNSYRK